MQQKATHLALHPFAMKTRYGLLLGLAPESTQGSPCKFCVEKWLKDRKIWAEEIPVETLRNEAKQAMLDLIKDNKAHVLYEIHTGQAPARLECHIYPHPDCECSRENYIEPPAMELQTSFSFSPIYQLKCVRYSTPDGNLWFFSATGKSPVTNTLITVCGVDTDKLNARKKAVSNWLREATAKDLSFSIRSGASISTETIQGKVTGMMEGNRFSPLRPEVVTANTSKEAALRDAFHAMCLDDVLKKYSRGKNPMMVVGASNWVRNKVPFFILQQYDLHLLFYPNQSPVWIVGIAAFSRQDAAAAPIFTFGASTDIHAAYDSALYQFFEKSNAVDWRSSQGLFVEEEKSLKSGRLNMWWTRWLYNCPKVSLKDLLLLESYQMNLEDWHRFWEGQKTSISVWRLNNRDFPTRLNYLIGIYRASEEEQVQPLGNVTGIGVWKSHRSPTPLH